MATNIRANWVVDPNSVAEYDRASRLNPLAIIAAGAVFFIGGQLTAVHAVFTNPSYTVAATVLSLLGLVSSVIIARRIGIVREAAIRPIVRDATALRELVVFDQERVDDYSLWVAAGIASEIVELDENNDRLASAAARTAQQESAYAEYESTRHTLALQALALVATERPA